MKLDKETELMILAQEFDVLEEIINIIKSTPIKEDKDFRNVLVKVEDYVFLQIKNHKDQIEVLKKELTTSTSNTNS